MKRFMSALLAVSLISAIPATSQAVHKASKAKIYCGMSSDKGAFLPFTGKDKGLSVGINIKVHDTHIIQLFDRLVKQGRVAPGKCDINLPKKYLKECKSEADCCSKNPDFCINGVSFLPTE